MNILKEFQYRQKIKKKSLALLLDPDKTGQAELDMLERKKIKEAFDFIFIGGSSVEPGQTQKLLTRLKSFSSLPIIVFPGSPDQISEEANALLFLNLISGRNPEYLIEKQIQAASLLKSLKMECISTSYILIDGGSFTSTMRVSKTFGLNPNDEEFIENTALAGQYMGHQCCYLEAGSGAINPIPIKLIKRLRNRLATPLIVGGGIRNLEKMEEIFHAGADIVVIGNHIEKHPEFINELSQWNRQLNSF